MVHFVLWVFYHNLKKKKKACNTGKKLRKFRNFFSGLARVILYHLNLIINMLTCTKTNQKTGQATSDEGLALVTKSASTGTNSKDLVWRGCVSGRSQGRTPQPHPLPV